MSKIKTRQRVNGTIKTIDKSSILSKKTKNSIINVNKKSDETVESNDRNINEYAIKNITNSSKDIADNSYKIKQKSNKIANQSIKDTKSNIKVINLKVKKVKTKLAEKKNVEKGIKTGSKVAKNEAKKLAKTTAQNSKRAIKITRETAQKTFQGIKLVVKTTAKTIKLIISGTKALIEAIIAGGWIAIIIIIVICLIGLLCSSCFGIFFSGEKYKHDSITMKDVIVECNREFYDRLQIIQDTNPHDEYILEGKTSSWKDVLLIYTIKVSNDNEVVTINDEKKNLVKEIYWKMNELEYEIKDEIITEQGINSLEAPRDVQKKVLHIKINSKSTEQLKQEYNFTQQQLELYDELSSKKYDSLWNSVIYGLNSGEYVSWRQINATWSNIMIGNTTNNIGQIGCLVTSIAILIEKSNIDKSNIVPFNPGTFVETLNNNGGFDNDGNLQYSAITNIIPNFKYGGNVNLREKSREEKFNIISNYFNQGYYLTVEVKGATQNNQHWVAIIGIDNNNIVMVDPASDHTDLWSAYEFSRTSQFNYFEKR